MLMSLSPSNFTCIFFFNKAMRRDSSNFVCSWTNVSAALVSKIEVHDVLGLGRCGAMANPAQKESPIKMIVPMAVSMLVCFDIRLSPLENVKRNDI